MFASNEYLDEAIELRPVAVWATAPDDRDGWQKLGDLAAGFGDMFVISSAIREFGFAIPFGGSYIDLSCAGCVDYDSKQYAAGQLAGLGASAGMASASTPGIMTRIAIHPAHHPFGRMGRLSHVQLNWWTRDVPGSDGRIRIPLPWR